jgi:hypothetical protein
MSKLYIVPLLLCLCACTTVPLTTKFPELPEELNTDCSRLNTLPQDAKLSDLVRTDVKNMVKYRECSNQVTKIREWYKDQKKNHENAIK